MKRMPMVLTVMILAAASAAAPPPAATSEPVTVEELIRRGRRTGEAVADGTARFLWTTRVTIQGAAFDVITVLDGARARRSLYVVQDGERRYELLTIIERDGVWYVREMGAPLGKYRPFEAPLRLPNAYLVLNAADLLFLLPGAMATVESVADGEATLRTDLPPQKRAQLQATVDACRDTLRQLGDNPGAEQVEAKLRELERLLRDGQVVTVDVRTGALLANSSPVLERRILSLTTEIEADERTFDVSAARWPDCTEDPTLEGDLGNLIMMLHSPMATPGNADRLKQALALRLVNLRTGQVRRVPFRGPAGLGGCFSRDRRKVYVSGLDMQNGGLAIYEIDLSTGENRRIGEGALPDGMALMSALSGDGTTLAVLMFSPDLQSQLYLVDLAGDKARPLGRPMDTAFLSWLDDGQGLILVDRKMVSMDEPTEDSVARMALDGTVTVLVPGRHPVLIPRRGRILFQQDDGWKTSDLDGRNVELYAGGMKGYGFPAVSPDGTRLVWMRFETGKMPQPVIQTFGSTAVTELDLGPGLWAGPAWR